MSDEEGGPDAPQRQKQRRIEPEPEAQQAQQVQQAQRMDVDQAELAVSPLAPRPGGSGHHGGGASSGGGVGGGAPGQLQPSGGSGKHKRQLRWIRRSTASPEGSENEGEGQDGKRQQREEQAQVKQEPGTDGEQEQDGPLLLPMRYAAEAAEAAAARPAAGAGSAVGPRPLGLPPVVVPRKGGKGGRNGGEEPPGLRSPTGKPWMAVSTLCRAVPCRAVLCCAVVLQGLEGGKRAVLRTGAGLLPLQPDARLPGYALRCAGCVRASINSTHVNFVSPRLNPPLRAAILIITSCVNAPPPHPCRLTMRFMRSTRAPTCGWVRRTRRACPITTAHWSCWVSRAVIPMMTIGVVVFGKLARLPQLLELLDEQRFICLGLVCMVGVLLGAPARLKWLADGTAAAPAPIGFMPCCLPSFLSTHMIIPAVPLATAGEAAEAQEPIAALPGPSEAEALASAGGPEREQAASMPRDATADLWLREGAHASHATLCRSCCVALCTVVA